MKNLLTFAAGAEAATGLALLVVPSLVGRILLGAELIGVAIPVARVLGIALIALGVASWLASSDAQSCAARGVTSAMALYDLGAVVVLGAAGVQSQPSGVALWPAVILHAAMAVWCVTNLLGKPAQMAK